MSLIYHPGAEVELVEAAAFYEQRVAGLGERFLREYDASITEIGRPRCQALREAVAGADSAAPCP